MAAEIHVGDVGTEYRIKISDGAVPFDPTLATTKEIIFKMPSHGSPPGPWVVALDAEVTQAGSDWFLTVTIDDPDFHSTAGMMSLQAHLALPDGTEYHSNIQALDDDGVPLQIHRNIAVPSP